MIARRREAFVRKEVLRRVAIVIRSRRGAPRDPARQRRALLDGESKTNFALAYHRTVSLGGKLQNSAG
jgi:hypothetical protein